MPVLFDDARLSTRSPGRSTSGLWLSVGSHAIVVVLIAVTTGVPEKPPAPRARPLTVFVAPVTLPSAPVVAPRLPVPPAPTPPMRELARAEVPKPPPVAPIVAKAVEPTPPPLLPPAASVIERPIETPEVQRPVETGLFERTNGARTSQAATAVTTGGFNSAARAPRGAAHGAGEVQTAGFDRRASALVQPAGAASTKPPIDRPVEIVFKPTPDYTDEARSARIEGTVSLELEFTAAGDVRVLRVVRGLGHGLDEAAQRAALRIRFKPAQSDAGPVDSRATVHITFRLS
jgi:TonB family protein